MIITYTIEESDYLTFQLYTASQSDKIKKRRIRTRVLPAIVYLCLSTLPYINGDKLVAYAFILLSIITYTTYPFVEKRRYTRHYIRLIKENHKGKSNISLEIDNYYLITKDQSNTTNVQAKEVIAIVELKDIIIVQSSNSSLIIPKRGIADLQNLISRLQKFANHNHIDYRNEVNWQWK